MGLGVGVGEAAPALALRWGERVKCGGEADPLLLAPVLACAVGERVGACAVGVPPPAAASSAAVAVGGRVGRALLREGVRVRVGQGEAVPYRALSLAAGEREGGPGERVAALTVGVAAPPPPTPLPVVEVGRAIVGEGERLFRAAVGLAVGQCVAGGVGRAVAAGEREMRGEREALGVVVALREAQGEGEALAGREMVRRAEALAAVLRCAEGEAAALRVPPPPLLLEGRGEREKDAEAEVEAAALREAAAEGKARREGLLGGLGLAEG